jgi:hypothetical protein
MSIPLERLGNGTPYTDAPPPDIPPVDPGVPDSRGPLGVVLPLVGVGHSTPCAGFCEPGAGVTVGVDVNVTVGVGVSIGVGVSVGIGVGVSVGVGVGVSVGVGVGVSVGVGVGVGFGFGVGVGVGFGVGVGGIGVLVGVGGTGVSVGGIGVSVGSIGVSVGGIGVSVGSIGVSVGIGNVSVTVGKGNVACVVFVRANRPTRENASNANKSAIIITKSLFVIIYHQNRLERSCPSDDMPMYL